MVVWTTLPVAAAAALSWMTVRSKRILAGTKLEIIYISLADETVQCVVRPQQRFLISPSLDASGLGTELTENYGWISLEPRQHVDSSSSSSRTSEDASSSSSSLSSHIYMPGSGIAKRLYLQWYDFLCGFIVYSNFDWRPKFLVHNWLITIVMWDVLAHCFSNVECYYKKCLVSMCHRARITCLVFSIYFSVVSVIEMHLMKWCALYKRYTRG